MQRLQWVFVALAVTVFTADVWGQGFPGGGFGRGGGGFGRGGGGFGRGGGGRRDPNRMFDFLSGGKDVVRRADLQPWQQNMFDRMAQQAGITGTEITREQFVKAMGGAGGGAAPSAEDLAKQAEAEFKRLDTNGDGKLNTDEMPRELLAQKDKWDTNKDGVIDLQEYTAYYKATHQQQQQDSGPDSAGDIPVEVIDEDQKPVVYHAGTIPKELEPIFSKYDANGDGQISLYEWRAAGGSIEDFVAMDRNNDGLVTVEEYLYYQSKQNGNDGSASPSSITTVTANASPVGGGNFNGFNRRGRGRRNRGGGGYGRGGGN